MNVYCFPIKTNPIPNQSLHSGVEWANELQTKPHAASFQPLGLLFSIWLDNQTFEQSLQQEEKILHRKKKSPKNTELF